MPMSVAIWVLKFTLLFSTKCSPSQLEFGYCVDLRSCQAVRVCVSSVASSAAVSGRFVVRASQALHAALRATFVSTCQFAFRQPVAFERRKQGIEIKHHRWHSLDAHIHAPWLVCKHCTHSAHERHDASMLVARAPNYK